MTKISTYPLPAKGRVLRRMEAIMTTVSECWSVVSLVDSCLS